MIYRYKATIPGSKTFVREYEIKPETTLFRFNSFILHDLGFSPDQMVLFRGCGADGKRRSRYGLFDLGDGSMDKVTFAKLIEKEELVLEYCYDLHNDTFIRLEFIGEAPDSIRYSYPRTTMEKGRNPDQFARKYVDLDSAEGLGVNISFEMDAPEEVVDMGDE
ncbi:MAG: hypothetical protein HUJ90_00135 [Bacteroidales bacterium]|nr:hypothetical protein [Bacteroidales bacterium]